MALPGRCVFYNAVCWVIVLAAYYPATHTVRAMVEDDNFAQTWYVFWVLPLAFILLNLFMIRAISQRSRQAACCRAILC